MRKIAFFPPFLVLVTFVLISIFNQEAFLGLINTINNWIIKNIGRGASILALAIVVVSTESRSSPTSAACSRP